VSNTKKKEKAPPEVNLHQQFEELKKRLDVAPPQELLKSMESIATTYLKSRFPQSTESSFEKIFQQNKEKLSTTDAENFQALLNPFQLMKYGGGQLPSHQVREVYNQLKKCIPEQRNRI
jgi:hypothetical protein